MISYLTGKNAEHKHTNKTRKRTHVQYFDQVTMPSFRQIAISGGGRVTLRILCKFGRENQLLCLHSQGWIYHQTMFSPPARWGLLYRFYQSCSSPPPSSSFSSSASSSSSTTSASTSTSTVALPTLGQALRQLRSSVRTAGPQPGTFPAQCAPLDLNLGPAELSAHRWTSTWGLPSSVRTAGPQKPDRMPEDMPDRMSDRMREDMPDKMP